MRNIKATMMDSGNLLVTFGNPISGTTTTCLWNSEAMRKVGLGAAELQEKCNRLGFAWRVVERTTTIGELMKD